MKEAKGIDINMNVVYYSSDFFSEMCGVAIESLCENNKASKEIDVYIVEDHISLNYKEKLKSITDKFSRKLFFIKMPTQFEAYSEVKVNLGRTYARMLLEDLLPQTVDRVISFDSDTIVLDSIEELYNTDFEGDYIAGVYDCVGSAIQKKVLHADEKMKYCNAGMYLVDLKAWRRDKVGDKLIQAVLEACKNKRYMYFLEQDLMNIIFEGKIKLLSPRYNMLTSIYLFDYADVIRMKKPISYYEKEEVNAAKKNPAILHATTCFYVKKRMWVENSDHPYAKLYLDLRNRTPWRDEPQIKDNRKKSKKFFATIWHCIPKKCAILFAAVLINFIRPTYAKVTVRIALSLIAEQSST